MTGPLCPTCEYRAQSDADLRAHMQVDHALTYFQAVLRVGEVMADPMLNGQGRVKQHGKGGRPPVVAPEPTAAVAVAEPPEAGGYEIVDRPATRTTLVDALRATAESGKALRVTAERVKYIRAHLHTALSREGLRVSTRQDGTGYYRCWAERRQG